MEKSHWDKTAQYQSFRYTYSKVGITQPPVNMSTHILKLTKNEIPNTLFLHYMVGQWTYHTLGHRKR